VLEHVALLGPFDTIYHLAALHFIPECVAHPAETLSVNVVGTQMLLDLVPCRRFARLHG
jgi:nucleoside-diphosphate-sugar epimerase